MKRILVVAAHPDDEMLGCGGTIARLARQGSEVHILILAEGLTSRDQVRDRTTKSAELSVLGETARAAAKIAGAKNVELLDWPDNRMDGVDLIDVIKTIEKKISDFSPDTIFTHFGTDLNIDHNITNQAVITATRPYPGQSVKNILFFEVASSTEWNFGTAAFSPNFFVPLTQEDLEKKISALRIYDLEMRAFPHARSLEAIRALANWRGATIGSEAAEAFTIARIIT